MKTFIASIASLLAAAAALAQGTVTFNNRVPGIVVNHVWMFGSGDGWLVGNSAEDYPPGNQVYSDGYKLEGSMWMAQLLAAPGQNQPASSLVEAITPATTFRTGAAAGFVVPTTAAFGNLLPDSPYATLQMAVWDNSSGLYPTWASAKNSASAWFKGLSPTFNLFAIGGNINVPPNLVGSVSWQLGYIPEPGTLTLAALGLVSLWVLRRRN